MQHRTAARSHPVYLQEETNAESWSSDELAFETSQQNRDFSLLAWLEEAPDMHQLSLH